MVGEGRKSRPRPQVIRECFLYLQAFWSFPYEDQQSQGDKTKQLVFIEVYKT